MNMDASMLDTKTFRRGFYFICIGSFFIMFSLATHLPAYPHMIDAFHLTPGDAVWMQLGLAVGLTGFQPLFGWLGDSYGIRIVMIIGAICMIIGSLFVALSISFWLLVLGLFFKGVAGAAVAPSGVAYAGRYAIGNERGKAMGTFTAIITIGALFGPVISGTVVDGLNWQAIFHLTAILGVFSLMIYLGIPKIKVEHKFKLDYLGLALIIVVILAILTVPTFINSYGFSSNMWVPSLLIFVISLFVLIKVEKKQKFPLLDIQYIFKKTFWAPTAIASLIFLGYSGVMYLLTFFVQNVQGKPATEVGLLQMVIFLGTSLASFISGRLLKYMSARVIIGTGILLFASGISMLLFVHIDTSFIYLFIAMAFVGVGSGFMTPAFKGIIVSEASQSRLNTIAFTNNVIENISQRLGASFALVAFALFSINGNAIRAMSNTSWLIMGFIVIALLLLMFIPKNIIGIHNGSEKVEVDAQSPIKENVN